MRWRKSMTGIAGWPRKHLLYNNWEQHWGMNEKPITYHRMSHRATLLRARGLRCNHAVVKWSINVIFNENPLRKFVRAWIIATAYLRNFWKVRPSLIVGLMKSLTFTQTETRVWKSEWIIFFLSIHSVYIKHGLLAAHATAKSSCS